MPQIWIENEKSELQRAMLDDIEIALCAFDDIILEEETEDGKSFICISYPENKPEILHAVARGVTETVLRIQEKVLLKKKIEKNYGYFNAPEKSSIFNLALINVGERQKKFDAVYQTICDYIQKHKKFSADGMINFRLKDYHKILDYTVDAAVERFLADKEYEEFLNLLRFFVNIQESKMNTLHVYVTPKQEYRFFNENKEEITNRCYIEFFKEYPYASIQSDDFLISSLINLSPQKIVLHKEERVQNAELKNTIFKVFENRVMLCPGCTICEEFENSMAEKQKSLSEDLYFS